MDQIQDFPLSLSQGKSVCDRCGAKDLKLFDCALCHLGRYCTLSCEEQHWPEHRQVCHLVLSQGASHLQGKKPRLTQRIVEGGEGTIHLAHFGDEKVAVKISFNLSFGLSSSQSEGFCVGNLPIFPAANG